MGHRFGLVTTCKNERQSIERWVSDVLNQTRQPNEICIVDAESTDGTREYLIDWAQKDPRVKVKVEKCKPAGGRNLAVLMCTCEVVVSTDMGCSLDHDWIKNICIPFDADPDIAVVVGNYQVNLESIKSPAAWADYYYSSYEIRKLKKGSLPFNRSVAYKKWAWNLLGGLPEDLSFAGDDTVMGLQLINSELRIEYVEDALVYWDRFSEIRDFWKEKYRYGYGNGEANIFYPELMMRVGYQPSMLHFWLHSLFIAIKRSVKPIFRSLLDGRLSPIVFIPLLILGDQIAYAKGFIEGNRAGKTSCISTRKRLLGITNL